MSDTDPRDEIERLEAQIEELSARLDSCRNFIVAARIAVACGGAMLVVTVLGVIGFDARILVTAIAAVLGGLVVWGANRSTAEEAADELAATEADRAALIGELELHLVGERKRLH